MHIVIGLVIAVVLAVLVYRLLHTRRAPDEFAAPSSRSARGFAYLSNGLLFYRERGGAVNQLQSAYVQEAEDRRERMRQRHSWKQGTSFNVAAGGGMRSFEPGDAPIQATSAVFDAHGDLLYFLKDTTVGGLFRRVAASGNELRLLLRQSLCLNDLSLSPDGGMLAATSLGKGGVANIALLQSDGSGFREVTGGDTVDSAPAWIPGVGNRLLFQSCGLARDEQGYLVAQGPASIQKLDMESGSVTPILDDPRFDHLKPRVGAGGELYFIRRPFEAPQYAVNSMLLDTLLFPFRLLRAVFHYLNFFSLMYSRKPLTSASGPAVKADMKNILLQGRRIDAEKALRSSRAVQGVPSLVPDNWQLVRRDPSGNEQVIATNVATYDVGPDGGIVYSNGRGVFELTAAGSASIAVVEALVTELAAANA